MEMERARLQTTGTAYAFDEWEHKRQSWGTNSAMALGYPHTLEWRSKRMKRIFLAPGEMVIREEVIENIINAVLNDDVTAREQSAAELKTLLDKHRERNN